MSRRESTTIVIPGDEPVQIAGSPQLDRLGRYGRIVLFDTRPANDQQKIERASQAECLINSRSSVKWPREVLRQLPNLRMITVCGIGTDSIDLTTCRQMGITVCNLPGRTAKIVAEHAFGLMFALAKRTAFQTAQIKAHRWVGMHNITLAGKTLGLIGAGPIAIEMARLAHAVGMNILAWTLHPSDERAVKMNGRFCDLDQLLSSSDVVSLHLPLTAESRHLIGRRELQIMKKNALLINTARGAVADEIALCDALDRGHLAGAALDVFSTEPLDDDHPLRHCEQVILTPHCGDQTPEGIELLNSGVVDNVIAYLNGNPQNLVVDGTARAAT